MRAAWFGRSRQSALAAIAIALVLLVVLFEISNAAPGVQSKITICHNPTSVNPETLRVSVAVSQAHFRHGDTTGSCNPGDVSPGRP